MNKESAINYLLCEFNKTRANNQDFNNEYEGWAMIKKEVDELWDEIKKRPCDRSIHSLKRECIQITAMALRFMVELT